MEPNITVDEPSTSVAEKGPQSEEMIARRRNETRRNVSRSIAYMAIVFNVLFAILNIRGVSTMHVDLERIAARLRIEEEILQDKLAIARHRRQLGTPKEEIIQVTAPIFSRRLFDYGAKEGDRELAVGLDVAKKLQLVVPIFFYGQNYSAVYVLSNGGIGFEASAHAYRANILPGNIRVIAPFWNRNDLRNGGHVFYRELTAGRVLERGQSEIRYQYDHEVKVQSAIVVTWDKMQPLGTAALPEENTNTFQLAVFTTQDGRSYANFIYSNIGWTQGAEAGFSNGDNSKHFALPTSGTGNIMFLEDNGNTGIPGEWMFVLGEERVFRCKAGIKGDICDEKCGANEWGADCAGCCHCAIGASCNDVTGECASKKGGETGMCAQCWSDANCQTKSETCAHASSTQKICAPNAVLFTDYDRCGEPTQRCECLAGFEGNGDKECRDVDECAQPNTCHASAVCTNTPGRFFCQCAAGFNGDGVSECIASFLYPHAGGQKLKHSRNAKVAWKLKTQLKIFGIVRDRIIISSKGLIIVKEKSKILPNDHLDDMDILGFAPFFAPIDYSSSGEVSISESTEADVLTRVTQLVNENLPPDARNFRATSVVIISHMNVSAPAGAGENTFQTLLIGGTNDAGEKMSFVQFLYKDLMWSDGAEAGIITSDKSNSIHLPGSGTAGIEQLSQLSNIRSPGIWMYRIDGDSVQSCMMPELQPPYCDAQSPTIASSFRQPSKMTTPIINEVISPSPRTESPQNIEFIHPIPPQIPHRFEPSSFSSILEESIVTSTPIARKNHSRQPTFSSHEISDMPSDVFDFPTSMTLIPKLMATSGPSTSSQFTPALTIQEEERLIPLPDVSIIQPEVIQPSKSTAGSTSTTVILPIEKENIVKTKKTHAQDEPEIKENIEKEKKSENYRIIEIEPDETVIVPEVPPDNLQKVNSQDEPVTLSTTVSTSIETTTTSIDQLFVFGTTTKKTSAVSKKPKYVIQKQKPSTEIPAEDIENANAAPYDPDKILDGESPANKLALFITISVIAGWLLVLVGVGAYVACKRRRNQDMLRAMYGPAYQIRPIGVGFTTRGGEKHHHHYETSYEDHLEKAARLSSEMGAYNHGGRFSLYGSYWNLTNSSHNGSHDGSHPEGTANSTEAPNSPNTVSSPTNTTENETDGSAATTAMISSPAYSASRRARSRENGRTSIGISNDRRGYSKSVADLAIAANSSSIPGGGILSKCSPASLARADDFSPLSTAGRYRPNYANAAAAAAAAVKQQNNRTLHYLTGQYRNRNSYPHYLQQQHVMMLPNHIILPSSTNSMDLYLPFTRYPPTMMRH